MSEPFDYNAIKARLERATSPDDIEYTDIEALIMEVDRLTKRVEQTWDTPGGKRLYKAISRITELEAKLERAKVALRPFAQMWNDVKNVIALAHFVYFAEEKLAFEVLAELEHE